MLVYIGKYGTISSNERKRNGIRYLSFARKLSQLLSKRDVDMTQGKIVPLLIEFAIPLMLGTSNGVKLLG